MTNKPKFKTKYERMIAYNSILNKLKEGKTYKEVAKEFNISTSMVSTITKKYPRGFTAEEIERERIWHEELTKKQEANQIPLELNHQKTTTENKHLELNTQEVTTENTQTEQHIETTNQEVNTQPEPIVENLNIQPRKTPISIFVLVVTILVCIASVLTTPIYIKYQLTAENVIYWVSFALNYLIIALVVVSIPIINNTYETYRLIQYTKENKYPYKQYLKSSVLLNSNDTSNTLKASLLVALIMLINVICCVVFYTNTVETLVVAITPSILFVASVVIFLVNYRNKQKVKQQLEIVKYIESKISKPL